MLKSGFESPSAIQTQHAIFIPNLHSTREEGDLLNSAKGRLQYCNLIHVLFGKYAQAGVGRKGLFAILSPGPFGGS